MNCKQHEKTKKEIGISLLLCFSSYERGKYAPFDSKKKKIRQGLFQLCAGKKSGHPIADASPGS